MLCADAISVSAQKKTYGFFEQIMQNLILNAKCKSQSSTDGVNGCFKVKRALFPVLYFAICILKLIAQNPQDFEQLPINRLSELLNVFFSDLSI